MRLLTYSDKDFDELFNFEISEKDRFTIKILFFGSFGVTILFISYILYLISLKMYFI
jgi:hypothetical protein